MDRDQIDRWMAASAQEITDWRAVERDSLRDELAKTRAQRDELVRAATIALDAMRSGQVLDWSIRDRAVAALARAVGERDEVGP